MQRLNEEVQLMIEDGAELNAEQRLSSPRMGGLACCDGLLCRQQHLGVAACATEQCNPAPACCACLLLQLDQLWHVNPQITFGMLAGTR